MCEDFESSTAGAAPNTAKWTVGGLNCFDGGKAVIDSAVAHTGKNSVRIDPGANYCGHAFIINQTPASMGPVVYARFYIRLAKALGDSHVTFVSMRDAVLSTASATQDLRMGGQKGILMWNRSQDDATLPELGPVGTAASVKIPAATWTCIEFGLNASTGTIQTWVEDSLVSALQSDGVQTADFDRSWLSSKPTWVPKITDFRIGWEGYGGDMNTVWADDIALSTSRIGCKL